MSLPKIYATNLTSPKIGTIIPLKIKVGAVIPRTGKIIIPVKLAKR